MTVIAMKPAALDIYERLPAGSVEGVQERVVLDHLQRERGRIKATAESGAQLRIFLDRGKTLEVGEILRSQCGRHVRTRPTGGFSHGPFRHNQSGVGSTIVS